MDFQGSSSITLVQQIAADIERDMEQRRQQILIPRVHHSIYPFPNFLSGVENDIQEPQLASFGPYHKGKHHLLPFEVHKKDFLHKFIQRIEEPPLVDVLYPLQLTEGSIRGCYSEDTNSMSSSDFLIMVLTDACFIIELFYQYEEDLDTTWPWFNELNTLRADLLKMGNQLPFFVLEKLFLWSCRSHPGDQDASNQVLRTMALRFFNQALGRPLDMVHQEGQPPKHLLDLIHSSLLPSTPSRNKSNAFVESIQCAEMLYNAGITLRGKKANSLLEIDFGKLQIPPFALKIPPLAINELTSTILVNCVALEQCSHNTSKHFTAYIFFMNCLVRQPEDVRFLRKANIIKNIQPNDDYVINLLDRVREKAHFNARDSYLWKQYRDINSYYDSSVAQMWCLFTRQCHNSLVLAVAAIGVIISLGNWLSTWLSPKKGMSP